MNNILLADDHALFRDSLKIALEIIFPSSKITAVGSWDEVRESTHNKYYDLLLLDLLMPTQCSTTPEQLEWESQLPKVMQHAYGAICIISASNSRTHVKQAFKFGVNGYICKTYTLEQMKQALYTLSAGKNYLPEELVWKAFKPVRLQGSLGKTITWRQQEVLELLAMGYCNKKIAQKLELSESTIKRHLHNLYRVIGAKNRTDAIRVGRQQGLLEH